MSREIYRDGYVPDAIDPEVLNKAFPPKTDTELTASVNKIIKEGRRQAEYPPVDTGEMPESSSIRDRALKEKYTLDYVIDQRDVNAMNNLSRKIGEITSSGDASGKEWKKCVNAELAKGQCSGGYQIGPVIPVKGNCRVSHGLTEEGKTQDFFVPSTIKAPMTNSNKIAYTKQYNRLKNIVASNDGPDHMDNVNRNREFAGKTARCDLYGLDTNSKGGRKTRGRKRGRKTRGRKTRGKKRVKKTRTKRKHVKKVRSRKRGRKTHGRKISKKRGTRKRSYRKRR